MQQVGVDLNDLRAQARNPPFLAELTSSDRPCRSDNVSGRAFRANLCSDSYRGDQGGESCIRKLGLQEVVWVFWATLEGWKHACEHLEPQIFLVA
jgi:hypothetical protein